ncbi:hypothetical protein K502DRAFT_346413 [Neoconidiobolus thromboides FSU 785]|nr:hypothetical protein K502DRAFT_346413 [Neoconidiobolus thromboides FSU 785]
MLILPKLSLQCGLVIQHHTTNGQVVLYVSRVLQINSEEITLIEENEFSNKVGQCPNSFKTTCSQIMLDHWKPIAVMCGFDHYKMRDILTLPRHLCKVKEIDQTEHELFSLWRILTSLPNYQNDERAFSQGLKVD